MNQYFFQKSQRIDSEQAGFTLIEMMAVVVIIGILASLAIPRYQQYVARSQISSAYMTLRAQQIAVDDLLMQGETPTMGALGYSSDGVIKHDYGNWQLINATSLEFTFNESASSLIQKTGSAWIRLQWKDQQWECTSSIAQRLLPQNCFTAS